MKDLILSKFPEYNEDQLSKIMSQIDAMSPLLKKSLQKYLEKGTLDEINLLGYTVQSLKDNYGMNEITAFLTLDYILREPEKAVESIKKRYDTICIK
ncbi:MAG TPA: hypothetical protein PLS56_02205 [Candidatus Dojkabacteria bacterium]|nr:hypothetical protein [Candidatus Dojkabacteria bacterium]